MKNWSNRKRATMKATRKTGLRQAALQAIGKKLTEIKKESKKAAIVGNTAPLFRFSLQ